MRGLAMPQPDDAPPRYSHLACGDCPIRERAVCAYCDGPALERLSTMKTYRDYASGRDILAAGEVSPMVGSIVRGVVKLTKSLPDGRAQMVGLLFPGDFVGHPGRERAAYDATAATEVQLCLFQRQPFETLLRETPQLEKRLLDMTLTELDAAREWLLLLGRKTARERIATFLMALAERARRGSPIGARGPLEFALPLTRGEMAEYLGLTIETVSRHMTRLRAEGVVAFSDARSLRVPDLEALAAEAGD